MGMVGRGWRRCNARHVKESSLVNGDAYEHEILEKTNGELTPDDTITTMRMNEI